MPTVKLGNGRVQSVRGARCNIAASIKRWKRERHSIVTGDNGVLMLATLTRMMARMKNAPARFARRSAKFAK